MVLEIPVAALLMFFGSIRLFCLPVLMLHILSGILVPAAKRDRWMDSTAILFLVLLLKPIDIEVGGFHGHTLACRGRGRG